MTGKAPPNLSQGVPPLLPNQYIMGPGGLLPAYPVSRSLVIPTPTQFNVSCCHMHLFFDMFCHLCNCANVFFVLQQIYGYEDLHMLQSRLPMVSHIIQLLLSSVVIQISSCCGSSPDHLRFPQPSLQDYYGITFPGPTAALSGRDGSLANNPYSGKAP